MTTPSAAVMSGFADEGYGKVADAFFRNLDDGLEVGGAVAVYRDGRKVVDLWGGYRNGVTRTPWQRDTIVNVFSTTKGVASLAVGHAVSRGLLSYDAVVADYWPEFAQAGKHAVTVRQLLSHQAGLCAIDPPVTPEDLLDADMLSAKLAAQAPAWSPGSRHGYHAISLGWYAGELIRRVDPAHRSLGRYFRDEIAEPNDLDFHIGLPAAVNRDRVAYLHAWPKRLLLKRIGDFPRRFALGLFNPFSLEARAFAVVRGFKGPGHFNLDHYRAIEVPAANGIGTARAIAKLYGDAALGGRAIGLTSATFQALTGPVSPPSAGSSDRVLHVETAFSLGFMRPSPVSVFGSSDRAFGTPGMGGSFGFADPDTGIGYSYVMNRLGLQLFNDARELALRDAVFRQVLGSRVQH